MGTEMVQMMMIKLIFIFMIMVDVSKEIIRSILHLIFHFYVSSITVYSILDIRYNSSMLSLPEGHNHRLYKLDIRFCRN